IGQLEPGGGQRSGVRGRGGSRTTCLVLTVPLSFSLPKHSYWFDFWAFVVFDIALFLFMYLLVP
uniref:Uncharacterized protein n=1 Tax=Cynoglossus semilaevis TaxID=244447 RepID=A0A3P8WPL5_CYNSE